MKNLMRFVIYFVYIIFIAYLTYWGDGYQTALKLKSMNAGNMMPFAIFIGAFPILIGVLLALPNFIILATRKQSRWQFDLVKFLAIGLPTFYWDISPTIYWSQVANFLPPIYLLPYPLSGIIFGYVLIKSFSKKAIRISVPEQT